MTPGVEVWSSTQQQFGFKHALFGTSLRCSPRLGFRFRGMEARLDTKLQVHQSTIHSPVLGGSEG